MEELAEEPFCLFDFLADDGGGVELAVEVIAQRVEGVADFWDEIDFAVARALNEAADHGVDALGGGAAEDVERVLGEIVEGDDAGADGVVDVVVDVRDRVADAHNLAFEGAGDLAGAALEDDLAFGVVQDAVADFVGEVEAASVPGAFEDVDNAKALLEMTEAAGEELVEDGFAGVSEGCVAKVVSESDSFGEVFVEEEGAGDGAGDLSDFEGVGHAGAVVIAFGGEKDLRLAFEAAEGL